jgi:hypothetical protein
MTADTETTLSGTITKDVTLSGEVDLDSAWYVNVEFREARLIYRGGRPPHFENCRFHNATFSFEGSAANTVQFLNAIAPASTNMRHVVLGLIPGLKD